MVKTKNKETVDKLKHKVISVKDGVVSIRVKHGSLLIDEEDYPEISKHGWNSQGNKHTCVVCYKNKDRNLVYLKEVLFPNHKDVIFLNRNSLDYRKENLMAGNYAIPVQSNACRKGFVPNIREQRVGNFSAFLRFEGKAHYLGCSRNELETVNLLFEGIRLNYPLQAETTINAIKRVIIYDNYRKAKSWGWV